MVVAAKSESPRASSARTLAERSMALDIYAPLLTRRRAEAMTLHFDDDLSFAEIAVKMRVSRQTVHEHVAEGLKLINRYESRLGLVGKTIRTRHRLLDAALLLKNTKPRTASLTRIAESLERIAGEL